MIKKMRELKFRCEVYEPTEPLIKDEKVRKFVRDWATFNKVETAYIKKTIIDRRGFEPSWFKITGRDGNGCLWSVEIHADYLETVSDGYDEETVPIAELCGEEEDNEVQS